MGLMRHERTTQLRGLRPDRGAVTQTHARSGGEKKKNGTFDATLLFFFLRAQTHTYKRMRAHTCTHSPELACVSTNAPTGGLSVQEF